MSNKIIPLYSNKRDVKDKRNKNIKNSIEIPDKVLGSTQISSQINLQNKQSTSKVKANKNANTNANTNDNDEQVISVNGINCIGPCYPSNTLYYNPLTLTPIKVTQPSCPTKKYNAIGDGDKEKTFYYDLCNPEDINKGYLSFDLFNDVVQIANTPNNFLKQIYSINEISDCVHFLSNSFDTLPIYSQRRLAQVIFEVYWKYIEFPKSLFVKKLIVILNQIYRMEKNKLNDEKKIINVLDKINTNSLDMYEYFINKF